MSRKDQKSIRQYPGFNSYLATFTVKTPDLMLQKEMQFASGSQLSIRGADQGLGCGRSIPQIPNYLHICSAAPPPFLFLDANLWCECDYDKIWSYTHFASSDRSSYTDDSLLYIYIYIYPKATFSDFHSVHWCNWCYKCHFKLLKQFQCNYIIFTCAWWGGDSLESLCQ